eukprot:5201783-Amphidinium_carterae.1
MAGFLERPEAALERGPGARRRRCGLGLLEQCRRRGPRSPDRGPGGTQGQVGQIPNLTGGSHCHARSPGPSRLGACL